MDELSPAEAAGLASYAKSEVFAATDAEGHSIAIADVGRDCCTVLVRDPDPVTGGIGPRASTVVLSKAALRELVESVDRWLNRA